jgi:hypothetical protein
MTSVSGLWRSLSSAGFWFLCEKLLRTTGRRLGTRVTISGGRAIDRVSSVRWEAFLKFGEICLGTGVSGNRRDFLELWTRSTLLHFLGIRGLLPHLQGLLGRGVIGVWALMVLLGDRIRDGEMTERIWKDTRELRLKTLS